MGTKCLEIEDIGEVKLFKTAKARNIRLTIKPFEAIRVSMPNWVSYDEAIKFVNERIEWIKKSRRKIENLENRLTIFDEKTHFKTRNHELILIPSHSSKINSRISNGKIKFHYPEERKIKDQDIQEAIREAIETALRREAKEFLPKRLCELSYEHQLAFNRVFIKNTKTQWGSCSAENNINLSIHLMRLPDHLIDYVLLHELAHTIEKNHSKQFWRTLDAFTEIDAKTLDKELNKYPIKIY